MLRVNELRKVYGNVTSDALTAVRDVSFSVQQGDFLTLLGPSGCGKTTTLQCIAGLETPSAGEIHIDGQPVVSSNPPIYVPASRRSIGMIFQSYAIWPHMTVFENVAFPLLHGRVRETSANARKRVMRALEMVQLSHLAERPAPYLSGGQQQRVALARAIAAEPPLILLDEPLSNLDAKLRDSMRVELRALIKSLGATAILVTHDQSEAMSMSDQVAVMKEGQIVQLGTPRDVFLRPTTDFVADFMGYANLISATVVGRSDRYYLLDTPLGRIQAICAFEPAPGQPLKVAIRPETFVASSGEEGSNRIHGQITKATFLGKSTEIAMQAGENQLVASLDPYLSPAVGDSMALRAEPDQCVLVACGSTNAALAPPAALAASEAHA